MARACSALLAPVTGGRGRGTVVLVSPLSDEDRAKVARFIAKHHVSVKEEVEADVAPHRGQSLEESWRDLVALGQAAAEMLAMQRDREVIALERDPPHPSYRSIIERLRKRAS